MKSFDEILHDKRILKVFKNVETEKVSKLKFECRSLKASDKCLVICTIVNGWEHVSVSHNNKIPSWLCMEEIKEMCFNDDEECFQFHPKMDNYINNNEFALHIWRRTDGKMEPPPHILVGFRQNHVEEDIQAAKELHEMLGYPLTDEELRLMYMTSTEEGRKQLNDELAKLTPAQLISFMNKF